mgnify:CR=1 FL=1
MFVLSFVVSDHFAEAGEGEDNSGKDYVHIRVQQRNGRKSLTTVQGLPDKFSKDKILKAFKKVGVVVTYFYAGR